MTDLTITDVLAREVIDSRGTPTIEVEVTVDDFATGSAIVPSGASTGTHEALELRDGDKSRFMGKGVLTAVKNVNEIIGPEIIGMNGADQSALDYFLIGLDGTDLKEKLGANAILGTSMAACRASAMALGIPLYQYIGGINANLLPVPQLNILNGGKHAANNVQVQEFMILPVGADNWATAIRWGCEVYASLKNVLKKDGLLGGVGDEGGFAPDLNSTEDAFKLIERAISEAGLRPGEDVYLGIDAAASEFYIEESGRYQLEPNEDPMTSSEVASRYSEWISKYPIISIEDGLSEDDWDGWKAMTDALTDKVQLVGDDLFVTNMERFQRGIDGGISNAILIKLNQIGTVTETLDCIRLARDNGMNAVISHRSGETEDSFIADFTVATGAGQIKTGAPARTDRVSKYNQLIRINDRLSSPKFAGRSLFSRWPHPVVNAAAAK
ncbi:MAG TPA: phosphopyruvate hydratase [bacterium]|jgi:enolase